jgi:hypothetical protein
MPANFTVSSGTAARARHESFLQLMADLESDSMRVVNVRFESVNNQIETVQKTAHT